MIVISAQRGGTIRETVAMAKVYKETADQHGSSDLVGEIVATAPSIDRHEFSSAEDLRTRGLGKITEAVDLVESKATPDELAAYRAFAITVAQRAAEADKSGGFLGIGGERVSDSERTALNDWPRRSEPRRRARRRLPPRRIRPPATRPPKTRRQPRRDRARARQPQRQQRQRGPAAEVVAGLAVEGARVAGGLAGARVDLRALEPALALAAPAHRLALGPEADPVAEDRAAGRHRQASDPAVWRALA